jgi:hypothetical protein
VNGDNVPRNLAANSDGSFYDVVTGLTFASVNDWDWYVIVCQVRAAIYGLGQR